MHQFFATVKKRRKHMAETRSAKRAKVVADVREEYQKINDAAAALLKGEISGEEFNLINTEALNNVDKHISEYTHK